MFTPADIRSPLLLIKSKKLSEQPGMVLMGNPPRWHQLKPDEVVPKDVHHALHKKGEIAAATKLSKDPEFQKLSPEEQVAKVQAHAKEVQDKNTASSKVATWKKKILSGQAPQPLEWKSFFALPRDKQNALFAELKADPETAAKLDEAMAKFRMEAVKHMQEQPADKAVEPEKDKQAEKPVEELKPLDHGELNIPGKTNKINAELDKYKAQQAKQAKADQKAAAVDKKANKAKAKELFAQFGQAMIDKYGEKLGKKEVANMLDQMVKWEPTKFIAMVEKYQKEVAEKAEKPDEAKKPKYTFKIKPHEDGFKIESDNGGGFVANKPKGMNLFGLPPRVFKTEAEAKAYLNKKGMTLDQGESDKTEDKPETEKPVETKQEKAPEADKKPDIEVKKNKPKVSWSDDGKFIVIKVAGQPPQMIGKKFEAEAKKFYRELQQADDPVAFQQAYKEKIKADTEAYMAKVKDDIRNEAKEEGDYDAKIQEYATGATYKQKAYKILSKDPDWQKLSAKDKFEELHNWYLMEQEKASLAGAMAKFKAALLSGKAPTKALVEKFNGLSKDDQAKVLNPVFEQKDKAEIGKLLEQSGAGNAPKAESQKASETDSPKDGDTKQGADGLLVFKNGRWHKQGEPEKAVKMVEARTVGKKTKKTKIKSEPPTLNYWTSKTNAVNHIKINPPVGKKFSEKESAALKGWLESEGYDVKIYDSFIDVFDPAYGSAVSNIPSGSALQKEKKAKESQQAYSEKKKESEDAKSVEYENSPSYAWIESKMGSDFTNTHNKLMLARFLDGVDKQFNGLTSKGWIEPLTQLGYKHQPGDGNDVVFKFLKDSYLKDKTEAAQEPEKAEKSKPIVKGTVLNFDSKYQKMNKGKWVVYNVIGDSYAMHKVGAKIPNQTNTVLIPKRIVDAALKKGTAWFDGDEKPPNKLEVAAEKLLRKKQKIKLTAKAAEALAYELGKKAHAAGHSAPATDDDLLKLLGQLSDAGVSTSAAQKAWYKGKTDAMLAAPVPGWTDTENQELAQAMGGEAPAETQVGKGTAWVTALAAGKKPDADIDNAIVTMPEERQQELFTKAAASWAKTQELDADENGVALGKLVLSDVMNDREHHEGDIKTINGVSYILQNGRWHRVQKSTDYGPQQKLEAMQALGSSDLMDEIDSGKISAKTDKLLDVMGPEAKASFYNWVATYKDYGFTVYRKAAVCAAYGHPNEVLLKDGTWVPFDPAMTTTSLAVPSDIHLQAVKEATLAAQNEPSTGPENPDTPQSFGHGTVTFVGPSKLHDLLAGKGWNVSDGPNFKHTFLKNMLDWSISQSKDDYNDWKQSMFYLHDMFPVGATVKFDDSGKATWKVIQGEKGVTFKNVLTGEIQNYKNKEDVAQLMGVLWNVNPTVIPPGHPAGKTIRDPVSDTVKVDSPEINVNGISYKKVDDVWQFKNSHGDWVAPQFSEEAISTLESKLAEMASGQPQGTVKIDGYPNVNFKKVDGEWKVVLEDGGLYPAGPVATGMLEKQYGAKSSDSSIITMDLPFVGETNYKKINGVWMTEDQKGNPDAGWHAINQDGGIVKDLEDKLKASQGDSYDVMQHPAVKDYIEMLSHSVNPTSGQTISLNSAIGDNGTKAHDEVIKQAAKAYAKLHNLKDNDPDDQALALDIVSALAYGDQGPQEGDTKTKNGHTYQLINGRWHRVDKDQDGIVSDLPNYEGTKFKKFNDEWTYQLASGGWAPVINQSQIAKLDAHVAGKSQPAPDGNAEDSYPEFKMVSGAAGEFTFKKENGLWTYLKEGKFEPVVNDKLIEQLEEYQKNNPITQSAKASPLDAIKPPHQAIDDSNLSPIQKEKLKEQLENLKTAAQQDGIAAFKGVVKYMAKSGKTYIKIPNGYKIIVHDNKDWNKPWSNELLQYIQDLKAATELASGKKPKKAATKKTSTASAPSKPVSLASKTEAIDDWKQVGGQGGYNPGGTYQDANGEEWYCKFPEGGDAVVKNELLAVQLYKAAGLTVPDVKLVSKNGKIGLGSKILKGAVEDKEWLKNGGGPGVMEGFAIDAWLANWDTVGNNPAAGKGFDNILKMPDGSAARIDAGGAMLYGGAGSLKGDKFGDVVTEMETLRDASKNPNTAKVFGQMTAADIKASVEKLALLSDVKIGTAVMLNGPGSIHDRIALFKKLLARKASILSKFPDLRPKAKEAVFDPDKIHTTPNFLNWGESGKSGPATLHDKNVANQEGVNKLFEVAKQTGDIEAIKAVQFPFIDKDGKVTHYVSALDHPSQWVSGYATQMVNEINNQMSPEQLSSLEFEDGAHPLSVLSAMFPAVDPGTFTDKIGNYCNLGYVGTFDKQDLGLPPDKTYKSGALTESTYAEAAKDAWKKMPAYQQQAVQSYTGSGYGSMNGGLWKGNPSGSAKAAKEALQTLSHPIESGTVLSRRIALSGEELDKLVGGNGKPSSEGKILMEPAIQSTSINPGVWTGGKNVSYRMTVGPGVKGLYVGYGSKPGGGAISVNASEQEILLPPDTKMLVQKITKTTTGTPDGFGGHGAQYVIEVVILPN